MVVHEGFVGPDMADAEIRAQVGFMGGTFKIPDLNPDAPDIWVENIRDALFTSGMSAVFLAADIRVKLDVPVRLRNQVDVIPQWKLAYAWTVLRRSLNGIPSLLARTQRCRFADVEALIRCVLDVIQKRSQGVETRLRDELTAMNLADYPSLAAYIADLEARFSKLAAHGVFVTDSEQRYVLLRGLTANYDNIKSSVLSYRDREGNKADLAMAIYLLEDYEDNQAASSTAVRASTLSREVTLATFNPKQVKEKVCFYFAKRGNCRRGSSCNFRHVERAPRPEWQGGNQAKRGRTSTRPKPGACRNCGREGHWARECTTPKQERANVLVNEDWSMSTREFVGHGLNFRLPYQRDKWLVDSASTCMVANEACREFSEVKPAEVTITVGGDNQLKCTSVGNLTIATAQGPVKLQEVRIVPGFGVNILSGPYLEKTLGLSLSSDGKTWWARRRGRQVLKGEADSAGLYWVTISRLHPFKRCQGPQQDGPNAKSSKNGSMSSQTPQARKQDGGSNKNSSNSPAPLKGGRSPSNGISCPFPHFSRDDEASEHDCERCEESSESGDDKEHHQAVGKQRSGRDVVCLTRQQTIDLMAAHLRWGHRGFRSCANVLGVPAPENVPFCEACVEAKASRHPRRSGDARGGLIREPATRPGFRLFFDPIGPFKEATLHRYKYALVVLDDFSGLLQAKFMVRLSEWFSHLSGLIKRIEAEKGSERVVAQVGSDSFPAFVNGHTMLDFAASRGILLLASPPYTEAQSC